MARILFQLFLNPRQLGLNYVYFSNLILSMDFMKIVSKDVLQCMASLSCVASAHDVMDITEFMFLFAN